MQGSVVCIRTHLPATRISPVGHLLPAHAAYPGEELLLLGGGIWRCKQGGGGGSRGCSSRPPSEPWQQTSIAEVLPSKWARSHSRRTCFLSMAIAALASQWAGSSTSTPAFLALGAAAPVAAGAAAAAAAAATAGAGSITPTRTTAPESWDRATSSSGSARRASSICTSQRDRMLLRRGFNGSRAPGPAHLSHLEKLGAAGVKERAALLQLLRCRDLGSILDDGADLGTDLLLPFQLGKSSLKESGAASAAQNGEG